MKKMIVVMTVSVLLCAVAQAAVTVDPKANNILGPGGVANKVSVTPGAGQWILQVEDQVAGDEAWSAWTDQRAWLNSFSYEVILNTVGQGTVKLGAGQYPNQQAAVDAAPASAPTALLDADDTIELWISDWEVVDNSGMLYVGLTAYTPPPAYTIPAPGAILLSGFGVGIIGWFRRRFI